MSDDPAATRRRRLAWLLLAAMPAFWSANIITARWCGGWFPAHQLAFWRWLVALVPMLAIAGPGLWAKRGEALAEWRDLLLLGALGMWVCGAFVYVGATTTTATNIGLIYTLSPVLILLLSALVFRERMQALQRVGAALALVGVVAIVVQGDPSLLVRLEFTSGDLWVLTASVCWAIYTVMLRFRRTALDPFVRLTAITIGGVLILLPLSAIEVWSVGTPPLEWRALAAVLIVGLIPGFGAFQAYSWLIREIGAARTGLNLYTTPLFNALAAWAILDERIRWYHAFGAALVLGGLYLANRRPRAA